MNSKIQTFSKQMLNKASEIKHYNVREFFVRKINYDAYNSYSKLDDEQMKKELETLDRIKTVQNLYNHTVTTEKDLDFNLTKKNI